MAREAADPRRDDRSRRGSGRRARAGPRRVNGAPLGPDDGMPAPMARDECVGPSPDGRGFPASAPVAQQAERPPRKRKVAGSCPARGSKRFMA